MLSEVDLDPRSRTPVSDRRSTEPPGHAPFASSTVGDSGPSQTPGYRRPIKILWIGRQIPLPLNSGDRLYTARLVESVAACGGSVTFIGLNAPSGCDVSALSSEVRWVGVPGGMKSAASFLMSLERPMVGARHRTSAYRSTLKTVLAEPWDVIVIDQYGMVWCLDDIRAAKSNALLVHVSHDFETRVLSDVAEGFSGNPLKRAVLRENARRTALAERRLTRACSIVTAITDEDCAEFEAIGSADAYVTLTPGYSGQRVETRRLDASLPRRAVMIGSFDWLAKQLNLLSFLRAAEAPFREAGIEVRIIGSIPPELRAQTEIYAPTIKMLGFVDDPLPEFEQARVSLLFEETGGGFKLKMLDYLLSRLPLYGLEQALVGLPPAVREHVASAPSMEALVARVVRDIDRIDTLNAMQDGAFEAARNVFSWRKTASALIDSMETCLSRRGG